MSKGAGIVQWYQTPVISGMNIGPGIQQDLHRLPPTIACTREFIEYISRIPTASRLP